MKLRDRLMRGFILCSFLLAVFATGALTAEASPKFKCGLYRLRGKLLPQNKAGHFLEFYPGTRKRSRILIRGIHAKESLKYQNRMVEIEAQVYVPGNSFLARAKYLKMNSKVTPDKMREPIQFLSPNKCGL